MKNRNAFTLVELLATIVLISLLLGLGVPGVMKISENIKKRSYDKKINLIEKAAILWGQNNKTRLQNKNECEVEKNDNNSAGTYKCTKIKVGDLIVEDYISYDSMYNDEYVLTNPITDKPINNCEIFVYRKNSRVYAYFDKTNCN